MSRVDGIRCALCVALGLAGPASASMQPMLLADLSLEELSDIEITSVSKRAQPLSDAAASIYVISGEDIRRSGATNLPEALRLAPNLQVAKINNGRYAITARGFNGTEANKLLVLVNGRSAYSPWFAGVLWDVQDMVLPNIARIEVISGPGGTLWGLNAVNGVINIITKPTEESMGTQVIVGGGTPGADIWASRGGRMGENSAFRAYAHHFYRQRSELESGQPVLDATRMSHAGFRGDWKQARDTLIVNARLQQGEQEQPAPGLAPVPGAVIVLSPIKTQGANLMGRWIRKEADGDEINIQTYVDHTERVAAGTYDQRVTIADTQFQYALAPKDGHAWVMGAAYRVAHDRVTEDSLLGLLPASTTQEWVSLFAQDDIALTEDLKVTLGARAESNDYTGIEWLPNARLAWKVSSEHLLWSALSRTVRAPSRIDRDTYIRLPAAPQPGPPYFLAGGDAVQAEIAKVLEVGWRGQPLRGTSLSLTAYRALYDHLHTQEPGGSRGWFVFAGGMKGAVSGLEGWGTWQPLRAWRLSAGFTATYQRFHLRPGSADVQFNRVRGRDPAQTWHARSAWELPGKQELDVMLRHVSRLAYDEVPSYLAADVRWGWRARPGLDLSLTLVDLIGRGHAEFSPQASRAYLRRGAYAQATLQF